MAFRRVQQLNFRQLDANGNPASNWLVYTYEAGLLTPVTTYSDAIGTPHANPIELSDSGEADIYLDDSTAYRFIIKDTLGAIYDDQDNITSTGGVVSGGGVSVGGSVGSIQFNNDGFLGGFGNWGAGVLTLDNGGNGSVVADFSDITNPTLKVDFDGAFAEVGAIAGKGYVNADEFNGGTLSGNNSGDQDLTGFVPYTGASSAVDLNTQTLSAGSAGFAGNVTATGTTKVGTGHTATQALGDIITGNNNTVTNSFSGITVGQNHQILGNVSNYNAIFGTQHYSNVPMSGVLMSGSSHNVKTATDFALLAGLGLDASSDTQAILGQFNANNANNALEIGNGVDNLNRSNALEVSKTGNVTITGSDTSSSDTGTLTGTSSVVTITLAEYASYIITAQLTGTNCESIKTAIVGTTGSNVVSSVSELSGHDYLTGSISIGNNGGISAGTFSADNGRKADITFDATAVTGTATWIWSIKRLH